LPPPPRRRDAGRTNGPYRCTRRIPGNSGASDGRAGQGIRRCSSRSGRPRLAPAWRSWNARPVPATYNRTYVYVARGLWGSRASFGSGGRCAARGGSPETERDPTYGRVRRPASGSSAARRYVLYAGFGWVGHLARQASSLGTMQRQHQHGRCPDARR
jgi:hypothetical protein